MVKSKTVLVVAYGGGHARMVAPVITELKQRHGDALCFEVLGLTISRQVYEEYGIAYRECREFLREEDAVARAWGEKLAAENHNPDSGISLEETIAYLGLSYADFIAQHGEEEAAALYAKLGRRPFMPFTLINRVFDEVQPDLVIATTSPRAEKVALLVAKDRGIPSLVISDLMGSFAYDTVADHMTVLNRLVEERYRAMPQVQVGQYHVAGNPAMDNAAEYQGKNYSDMLRSILPAEAEEKKRVLLFEQNCYFLDNPPDTPDDKKFRYPPAEERFDVLNAVAEATRKEGGVLLLRERPHEVDPVHAAWLETQKPEGVYLLPDCPLHPLLSEMDVCLSGHSTVLLDALYMSTPIIMLKYPNDGDLLGFDLLGYAGKSDAFSAESLQIALHDALYDETNIAAQRAAFESGMPALPCAPKVADVVEQILAL